jgi:hypothetical protein
MAKLIVWDEPYAPPVPPRPPKCAFCAQPAVHRCECPTWTGDERFCRRPLCGEHAIRVVVGHCLMLVCEHHTRGYRRWEIAV